MIMSGSTASNGNYRSKKGRFSFGCTVLFSCLRYFLMFQQEIYDVLLAYPAAVDPQ